MAAVSRQLQFVGLWRTSQARRTQENQWCLHALQAPQMRYFFILLIFFGRSLLSNFCNYSLISLVIIWIRILIWSTRKTTKCSTINKLYFCTFYLPLFRDAWNKERSEKENLAKNIKLQHQQQQGRAQEAEVSRDIVLFSCAICQRRDSSFSPLRDRYFEVAGSIALLLKQNVKSTHFYSWLSFASAK